MNAIAAEVKAITTDKGNYIFSTDDAGYQKSAMQLSEKAVYIYFIFVRVHSQCGSAYIGISTSNTKQDKRGWHFYVARHNKTGDYRTIPI